MTEEELTEAMNRLYTYDSGFTAAGLHDNALKERIRGYLETLTEEELRKLLVRVTFELFLTDEALEYGFGLEDVRAFVEWLEDNGMLLCYRR